MWWSMRTADWALIGATSVGAGVAIYAFYDYQKYQQQEQWNPTPRHEPHKAGRFSESYPMSVQEYKKSAKKQMTLEEIEWTLRDRQERYEQQKSSGQD